MVAAKCRPKLTLDTHARRDNVLFRLHTRYICVRVAKSKDKNKMTARRQKTARAHQKDDDALAGLYFLM